MTAREQLATFDLATIPTLDVVVRGALELFSEVSLSPLSIPEREVLVLGSGNAFMTAQIIFAESAVGFADESSYQERLARRDFAAVVVVSASGSKHAIVMVEAALQVEVPVYLVTNVEGAPAAGLLSSEQVFIYPKNREPYTYNTSTYLGPIFATTGEMPHDILEHIDRAIAPRLLRSFEDFSAFTFLIPPQFLHVREMVRTKFDELFGPQVVGRIFTTEEVKHAKTVVTSGDELFIALGVSNEHYGLSKNRLQLTVPEGAGYATYVALLYYIVGRIQAAHPPYFAQGIEAYAQTASTLFGQTIKPIVE